MRTPKKKDAGGREERVSDERGVGRRMGRQRQYILTNKLAANTHVIARKTQIAQCAAVNNSGDTWNIIRWWAIMF